MKERVRPPLWIECVPLLSVGVLPQPGVAAAALAARDVVSLLLSAVPPVVITRSAATVTAAKMD
ncbi:hypothetical protein AB0K12_12980 [Nonomuraea sp. NPDC049419]|uniref:hypothetical protein n=1 Tax=Nonomuraea sp. NPDC049419 TaxID=3155772 RepID=UPI0034136223